MAAGDTAAFRIIMDRSLPKLLQLARKLTGNHAAADDVVQEAMIKLWQKAPEWREGQGSVQTWLNRVVVNLSIDFRRRQTPLQDWENEFDPPDLRPGPEIQLLDKLDLQVVVAAMDEMPAKQNIALKLFHQENLNVREIAEVMEVTEKSVENLLFRGRRYLRQKLKENADGTGRK